MLRRLCFAVLLISGCKSRRDMHVDDQMPAHLTPPVTQDAGAPRDAGRDAAPGDGPTSWPALADLPIVDPVRVIGLPARSDVPRFDVGGPIVVGDVAVVSSSQFGFVAVDWRRGELVWTKPAGSHVAPPVAKADSAVLIGDCLTPPEPPGGERLLGCVRVVTKNGADESYAAIHGAKVDAFAEEPGVQQVWLDGERRVRWRRGDQAVTVDLLTGAAAPASIDPPPVHVVYRNHAWDISRTPERIVARERGKLAWQTRRAYGSLLGAVYLAELAPMVRVASLGAFGGIPELNLLDIDATGSLHGQVAFPVPGIATLGDAIDSVGNTAIAVRLDASLHHDFVVGYAANALLMYVYPLPEVMRADPVGVVVASDAVLVFHDGDTFTVLPELSAPPTAPGAPSRPSDFATP